MTLTFDLVTAKCIGFLCYSGWMCGPSLRRVGQDILEFFEQKQFWNIWPWWPLTPKSIGFLCCPGRTCGSLRKVHHGVLQLLFGNEKVTGGETDRHVQSNMPPSPSKGGIKIHNILPSSNSQIINSVEVRSQYSRVSKDLVSEGVHSCQHNADICSCHPFLENTRIKVKITPSSSQIWWI